MSDDLSPLENESIALDLGEHAEKKKAIHNLSGAAFVGEHLYLANDEGTHLLRVKRDAPQRYAACESLRIADLFKLQDGEIDSKEFDLEALAIDTHDNKIVRLWLIGSHAMGHEAPPGTDLKHLGLKRGRNRLLFGCVSVDARGGLIDSTGRHLRIKPIGETWTTHFLSALRQASPMANGFVHEASALTQQTVPDALAQRVGWFTPYTMASTKENGLDVEGLAIRRRDGDRATAVALVGLRGPVIDGLAVLIEVDIRDHNKRALRLTAGPRFHLLDLCGFGIRDLEWRGDDLLILAGPTMTRQRESALFRWNDAWTKIARGGETVVEVSDIEHIGSLPMPEEKSGPEVLTTITAQQPEYMLLRDGIGKHRLRDQAGNASALGPVYHTEVYRIADR